MSPKNLPIDSINKYIQSFPTNVQSILQQLRETIQRAAPNATETIKYGIPTFKLGEKNLLHFAGWKTHIGFYPTPSGIDMFKQELSQYKIAKGSIQFPLDKPLPLTLIQKIVQYRVKESTKELHDKK